jgi:predicted kinase
MKSLSLHKPHLLVIVGIPGSGKTFFASQFADTFNAPFIHYDAIQATGEPPLSEADTAAIAGVLFNELVKTKQTIIIEGPGETRTERAALAKEAHKHGYEPLFVWVQTEPATANIRAVQGVRGGTNTRITQDAFEASVKRFTALSSVEKPVVISGKHTYASQAKMVLKRLVAPEAKARQSHTPTAPPPRSTNGRITVQ